MLNLLAGPVLCGAEDVTGCRVRAVPKEFSNDHHAADRGRRGRPCHTLIAHRSRAFREPACRRGTPSSFASQAVFNDRAAEQARMLQFADQLKYALRWDDLHRQMYPYVQ